MTALSYDVHGPPDRPVVVLGSSLGTTRSMWDPQLALLSQHFQVIRYDHLGHGSSPVPSGPYTIEDLAARLCMMLDELDVPRAHMAGLSLGGMVALQVAATAPERVDRIAVLCSSAHLPPATGWRDRAAAVRSGGMQAVADVVASRWFTARFQGSAAAVLARKGLVASPVEGYAGCCEAIAAMDLRPLLGAVRSPTLAIAGAEDPATPAEHLRRIADGILAGGTPARVELMPGAAHLANVERPEEVGRLLLAHFLGKEEL